MVGVEWGLMTLKLPVILRWDLLRVLLSRGFAGASGREARVEAMSGVADSRFCPQRTIWLVHLRVAVRCRAARFAQMGRSDDACF